VAHGRCTAGVRCRCTTVYGGTAVYRSTNGVRRDNGVRRCTAVGGYTVYGRCTAGVRTVSAPVDVQQVYGREYGRCTEGRTDGERAGDGPMTIILLCSSAGLRLVSGGAVRLTLAHGQGITTLPATRQPLRHGLRCWTRSGRPRPTVPHLWSKVCRRPVPYGTTYLILRYAGGQYLTVLRTLY